MRGQVPMRDRVTTLFAPRDRTAQLPTQLCAKTSEYILTNSLHAIGPRNEAAGAKAKIFWCAFTLSLIFSVASQTKRALFLFCSALFPLRSSHTHGRSSSYGGCSQLPHINKTVCRRGTVGPKTPRARMVPVVQVPQPHCTLSPWRSWYRADLSPDWRHRCCRESFAP